MILLTVSDGRAIVDSMEPQLHDLHGLSAALVAAICGQNDCPLDEPLVQDGLLRLSAMICDMAGDLKAKQEAAFASLSSKEIPAKAA
jgi:hypothetical protein